MIAKGDYPYELHIPFPFSLVSNQADTNELTILPGYWFMYNLYALARNSEKYKARDQRIDRSIYLEYDYLAPDTVKGQEVIYVEGANDGNMLAHAGSGVRALVGTVSVKPLLIFMFM